MEYDTNKKSSKRDLSKVASTTGNIYGVYDMSGGSWEFVMGSMLDSGNAFSITGGGTWDTVNKPLDRYYDKYSYGTSDTEYTRGKLGYATIEMQPTGLEDNWYQDYAYFLGTGLTWFGRGDYYISGPNAGLFFFGYEEGYGYDYVGSRTVLSVLSISVE